MKLTEGQRQGWYVVQVRTGMESRMCALIERACDEHDDAAESEADLVGLRECFSPSFKSQKKWKGEFREVEYPLLPGYVIADAQNPVKLAQVLRGIHDLSHVLTAEETYVPLNDYERMWVESYTEKGDRVVPMSFGYREGDELIVTEGPLKGQEARIVRVDRANSLAHLELHVGPVTIKTKVGLGIVPKRSETFE